MQPQTNISEALTGTDSSYIKFVD
ncbi:uncharacterized protein METZ01_LOCUS26844 [marine metagenome]|uniref:Uncharacterized protein n=1 Tax=marine metagenome TaxID=408172 RepID=A0A381Q4I1_9ZZZZ